MSEQFSRSELEIVERWLAAKEAELKALVDMQADDDTVSMAEFCQNMLAGQSVVTWHDELHVQLAARDGEGADGDA